MQSGPLFLPLDTKMNHLFTLLFLIKKQQRFHRKRRHWLCADQKAQLLPQLPLSGSWAGAGVGGGIASPTPERGASAAGLLGLGWLGNPQVASLQGNREWLGASPSQTPAGPWGSFCYINTARPGWGQTCPAGQLKPPPRGDSLPPPMSSVDLEAVTVFSKESDEPFPPTMSTGLGKGFLRPQEDPETVQCMD